MPVKSMKRFQKAAASRRLLYPGYVSGGGSDASAITQTIKVGGKDVSTESCEAETAQKKPK